MASSTLSLNECVSECAQRPEFVAAFNRMTGLRLPVRGSEGREAAAFRRFVYDCVWSHLPPAATEAGTANYLRGLGCGF
jgi:hypothetical protein